MEIENKDYLAVLGGPIGTGLINTVHTVSPAQTGPSNRMENTGFEIRLAGFAHSKSKFLAAVLSKSTDTIF